MALKLLRVLLVMGCGQDPVLAWNWSDKEGWAIYLMVEAGLLNQRTTPQIADFTY